MQNNSIKKVCVTFCTIVIISMLSGCVAKDVASNEQQKRMQRCEQYVDRERDACLRGDFVSIQDYKDEYQAFQRSKEREEADKALKLPVLVKPINDKEQAVKQEEKLQPRVIQSNKSSGN